MARTPIKGTDANDWFFLQSATGAVEVEGGLGQDGIFGSRFDDLLRGGDGNDQLWGGNGGDTLDLGVGDDQAWGEEGDDRIATGGGNDTVFAGIGHDGIEAGVGNDQLAGEAGNDTIRAGDGRNIAWAGDGDDSVTAGIGDDSITGDAGNDTVLAGDGRNTIWAGQGADSVAAGIGNDTIGADDGNDTVLAGAGQDVVWANGGDDLVDLGAGDDSAAGDMGADTLIGGEGNDTVAGGEGHDSILAGAGADRIFADGGNDTVVHSRGGAAGDLFDGGWGSDTLGFDLTAAEWRDAGFQAELGAYLEHLARTPWADFTFASQSLTVRNFELVAVIVDGRAMAVADDPVAALDDAWTVSEDALAFAGDVTANDGVPDLVATVAAVSSPGTGLLGLAADGRFTWTFGEGFQSLAANDTRSVTFAYSVADSDGDTATARVTLTVIGANDAATITGSATGIVTEDGTLGAGGRLAVTDPDAGQSLFARPAALAGTYGSFTFDEATGDWTYLLDNASARVQALAAGQQATDRLLVQSLDGTASREIVVTINGTSAMGPNLLVNGGFEEPAIAAGTWQPRSDVPGWTNSAGPIEVWDNYIIRQPEGNQAIEIDYHSGLDAISQTLDVTTGREYELSFQARARRADMAASESFDVLWNGSTLATVNPSFGAWTTYSFRVTGKEGPDTLTFAELAAGNDTFGGLLDNVQLRDPVW